MNRRVVRPSLEYPKIPLYRDLEEAAGRWPEKVALIQGEHTLTYAQLDEQVNRFAAALAELGVEKGSAVALYLPNSPEFVIGFFGALKAGGVPTALNPAYKEREVAYQYEESEAVVLFTRADLYPVVAKARQQVRMEVVLAGGEAQDTHRFEALLERTPPRPPIDPLEDLAALPFTSGTTGYPKGVMLTHYNLSSNWRQFISVGGLTERDTLLIFLPFYHIYGTMLMGGGLLAGATEVLMERFDPQLTLELVQKYKPTVLYVVPPVLVLFANWPDLERCDLSSLNYILSGAAPLSVEVARRVQERTGVTVLQGYGLTETAPVTHCNPLDRAQIKLHTVGPPVPDTEHKVVDLETREDLPVGEVGELAVRGPQVMKGYWKRPEETAAVFQGEWFLTGDVARIDEDNYAQIVDRAKDMIKYKGFGVGPAELEEVLFEHPAVADCAVIGVPDPEAGEVPKAFVVKRPGTEVSAEELMAFVAERVAGYKQVREVEFIEAIPKNPSGKILKKDLLARERERR